MSRSNSARRRVGVRSALPVVAFTALAAAGSARADVPTPTASPILDPTPIVSPDPSTTPLPSPSPTTIPGITFPAECSIGDVSGVPGRVTIGATLPPTWNAGTELGPASFQYLVELDSVGRYAGAHFLLHGLDATASTSLILPSTGIIPFALPGNVTSDPVSVNDLSLPKRWTGTGEFPSLTAPAGQTGSATFDLNSFDIRVQARTGAGTPTSWYTRPAVDDGSDPSVGSVDCTPTAQPATFGSVPILRVPPTSPTPTPTPTPTPVITPSPTPLPSTTPPPTPDPGVTPTPVPTAIPEPPSTFTVTGSTQLRTLTQGTAQLAGSVVVRRLGADFAGDLTMASGTTRLRALGVIPLTAKLTFAPQSQLTGTFRSTSTPYFTGSVKEQIKLSNVSVLGIAINVGSNCSTTGAITMNLAGPFGAFGGTLAGTYPITALSACGGLTTLLNPVITGNGNKIALSLK